MNHQLSFKFAFKVNGVEGHLTQNCTQCQIEITVTNVSSEKFPGGKILEVIINSVHSSTTSSTLDVENRNIPDLEPGGSATLKVKKFGTYYSGHCHLVVNVIASDANLIDLFATNPLYNESPQITKNRATVSFYIESEDSIWTKNASKWSLRLSALAVLAAVAAVLMGAYNLYFPSGVVVESLADEIFLEELKRLPSEESMRSVADSTRKQEDLLRSIESSLRHFSVIADKIMTRLHPEANE